MNKRQFIKSLFSIPALLAIGLLPVKPVLSKTRKLLVQNSPINGLQYHRAKDLLYLLQPGDPVQLIREPDNRFDSQAVALYWHGDKLGYLPRVENTAVAQMLDRGEPLRCNIGSVTPEDFPWASVRVRVEAG